MRIKTVMLASAVVIVGLSGARAADAIVYEEPILVVESPSFNWNGAYIGGQVGYGWGESSIPGGPNLKPKGFLGGIYAGYNFDLGKSVILGLDGDLTYNNLKDSYSETLFDGKTVSIESKQRWSGAVRARAGYAIDRFLPYIAGGVAFGSVKNTASLTDGSTEFIDSKSKNRTGFTVGAGVDYAATDNVIVRLEYRYTNYGDKKTEFVDRGQTITSSDKFKSNEVRLGVAYKF